ncbi:MAG: amidohydrolase [Lachnospiraceae bacterium]|nr:amidohydrolase [Lachnospiraceae bacterium]
MDRNFPVDTEGLVALRREIHMHPELGWDLDNTCAIVCRELDRIGISYERDTYGRNSVVATINPHLEGFTMALRADMDALPIQERNDDKPYRSQIDGKMHACGHDAHTAMLIKTAEVLYGMRDEITCRVKLIFQPSEESRPSGAGVLCANGVMKDIDCIAMCHVNCGDRTHVISSNPGVTNSSSVAFKITLGGVSVHVASPHLCVDALAAGVRVYNGIQTIVSREVDPFDTVVMAVCKMHAGSTVSTNADECILEGSIRCINDNSMAWARQRLEKLVRMTAEETGTTWSLTWSGEPLPSAHNTPAMYEAFRRSAIKVVGEDYFKILPPSPGAEDFAYYEKEKPGLLFGLGLRNQEKGTVYPAHTKDWDIDEDGLETGVRVFVQFILDNMNGIAGL